MKKTNNDETVHEDIGESACIKERIYANVCVFTENDTTSREATRGTRLSSFTKFGGGTRRNDPQVCHWDVMIR